MSNVDQAEIAKFESVASQWWNLEGEFKPLHDINPLRLNYINERVGLAKKQVLDVGCGGGILSEGLARRGAMVTGIDMGEANLKVAAQHAAQEGLDIDYQMMAVEEFAQQHEGSFDVVTCLEMLEHVPAPDSIVAACARLVKPGGHLFFSTINRNPKSYALAIVGAEYIMNLVPKGTHDYMKFIKPSELCRWARGAGLQVEDVSGMSVNPIAMTYKVSKDVDVNYFLHCTK